MRKTIKYTLASLLITASLLAVYAYSAKDIEPVCHEQKGTQVYLLNYVSKQRLKTLVENHNRDYQFKGEALTRLYLLHPVFSLPQGVLGDSGIDYKKDGCTQIDNMDIYCEVRYSRQENGQVRVWYNFMK